MARRKSLTNKLSVLFSVIAVALFSATMALGQEKRDKSLYERLGGVYAIATVVDDFIDRGGVYAIATVVDDFIDRVVSDDILNANPAIKEARDRVPKAGLKFQVTALVCQVTGGPQTYVGRTMKDAHAKLNISEREWQALGADFKASLDKFKVPEKEQRELFAIVEGTKKDIVTR